VLASPLLLPAAAALLDGHHRPRPWPCPSAACPSAAPHTPSTPRTERRGATGTPQPAPRYSLPTRVLETPHRSPCTGASKHRAPCSAPSMPARAPASPPRRTRLSASRKLVWPPVGELGTSVQHSPDGAANGRSVQSVPSWPRASCTPRRRQRRWRQEEGPPRTDSRRRNWLVPGAHTHRPTLRAAGTLQGVPPSCCERRVAVWSGVCSSRHQGLDKARPQAACEPGGGGC
jgi:hypothetical protein